MMNILRTSLLAILITVFTGSCSVISHQIKTESIPSTDFKILVQERNFSIRAPGKSQEKKSTFFRQNSSIPIKAGF